MEKIRRDKHMGKAYDVAVIGAGAIGSSVAYFNAKKGASVVLIDAESLDSPGLSSVSFSFLSRTLQRSPAD